MAKRIAEKELTDRNWDQEDDAEEVGTFSVATDEVLKNRAIKKAKRRNVASESESGGAFKGFKGLVVPSGASLGPRGFGFGNGAGSKPLEGLSNGSSAWAPTPLPVAQTPPGADKKVTFGHVTANGPKSPSGSDGAADLESDRGSQQPSSSSLGPQGKACGGSAYHRQLAALNRSVRDWIVKHVDANPLCDLTPIFKDYERYLTSIERLPGNSSDGPSQRETGRQLLGAPATPAQPPRDAPFSFRTDRTEGAVKKQTEAPSEKKPAPALGVTSSASFHFGQKVDGSASCPSGSGPKANFFCPGNTGTFGKDGAPASSATSFSSKMPESHPDGAAAECRGTEEEESEEPPKVIVMEVKEDDAFYSKKCKLFYKKDDEFKEKGVGTLHLKPAANQKTQLLVRADTNLGNILLNVLVPPNMPCSRMGKNNVLIVCVPNPPISEKNATVPVTMLIRVKTAEDADELHKILQEKKEA